jgi:hypothetical protein
MERRGREEGEKRESEDERERVRESARERKRERRGGAMLYMPFVMEVHLSKGCTLALGTHWGGWMSNAATCFM